MSALSTCRAAPRVTRDPNRGQIRVLTGADSAPSSSMLDTVTQYAAPIAGVAAGLVGGVLVFGGQMIPTLGLGAAGGLAGYFLGGPGRTAMT